jgi:ABC-type Na+ transport system ATPase subunit NatA
LQDRGCGARGRNYLWFMPTYSLETQGLFYQFSRGVPVLEGINLQVPEGSIYGFPGPNGAGKTTTLRLVLGLLRRRRGEVRFFGRRLEANRFEILRKVGTLVETPSIYGQLTAAENLEVWRRLYGCDRARIGEVLRWVGLEGAGGKHAGKFSLGMKQRLGIAIALLNDPMLLILDEPANGLDPGGMVEVRELLLRLNRERGVTILLSSHLLWEIQKLPMGVVLVTSLIVQLEYRSNAWKQLAAAPVSYPAVYLAKLGVILVLLLEFFVLFNLGIWLEYIGKRSPSLRADFHVWSAGYAIGFLVVGYILYITKKERA